MGLFACSQYHATRGMTTLPGRAPTPDQTQQHRRRESAATSCKCRCTMPRMQRRRCPSSPVQHCPFLCAPRSCMLLAADDALSGSEAKVEQAARQRLARCAERHTRLHAGPPRFHCIPGPQYSFCAAPTPFYCAECSRCHPCLRLRLCSEGQHTPPQCDTFPLAEPARTASLHEQADAPDSAQTAGARQRSKLQSGHEP